MKKALQTIKLPAPQDITREEMTKYDKQSAFLNENFKILFDGIDELKKEISKIGGAD